MELLSTSGTECARALCTSTWFTVHLSPVRARENREVGYIVRSISIVYTCKVPNAHKRTLAQVCPQYRAWWHGTQGVSHARIES